MLQKNICLQIICPKDGVGANFYPRILLYSTSKILKCGYLHTPITEFVSNYGDGLLNSEQVSRFLAQINTNGYLGINSCKKTHEEFRIKLMDNCNLIDLITIITLAKLVSLVTRKHYTIRVPFLTPFIDSKDMFSLSRYKLLENYQLHVWDNMKNVQAYINPSSRTNTIKIVTSIAWARAAMQPERRVPITWFSTAISAIVQVLENHGIEYSVIVHTDALPDLDKNREFFHLGKAEKYLEECGIKRGNKMAYSFLNFGEIFSFVRKVQVISNRTPAEIWRDFSEADIILSTRSDLSFVGTLISKKQALRICASVPGQRPLPEKYINLLPQDDDAGEITRKVIGLLNQWLNQRFSTSPEEESNKLVSCLRIKDHSLKDLLQIELLAQLFRKYFKQKCSKRVSA